MVTLKQKLNFIWMIILFCFPGTVVSQGEWNNWHFGVHAAMTFVNGDPVALPLSAIVTSGGMFTFSPSDSAGNLLFYSNGRKIWARNNTVMPNGINLLGGINATRQPVFAVPVPGNRDQHYLFTVGSPKNLPLTGLHYSVVDMTLNGGFGDIIPGQKNIPVPMGDSAFGQLTGIRHSNNRDVWIVVNHHGAVRQYLSYLVSPAGISGPVVSPCSIVQPNNIYELGMLRISQDGLNLVCSDSIAELCYFNPSTGVVSRRFTFIPVFEGVPEKADAFEFSVDSKYLYCAIVSGSIATGNPVWQFDVKAIDSLQFMQSGYVVGASVFGSMQLAADGRIYLDDNTWEDYTRLNRINNPSVPGAGCNYEMHVIYLPGINHNGSLPQFLQRYKAYILVSGNCQYDSVRLTGDIWPPADTIRWNFGDPASGAANVSALATPFHLYSTPGDYTVELYVRHNDNRTDTTWRTITIHPSPQPVIGADKTICLGNSVTFDAGFCSGCDYEWKDVGSGLVVGTNQTFNTGTAGIYSVNVTNGNGCHGYDTVQLITTPVPQVANTQFAYPICSGENPDIQLTSTVFGTMFHWTASLTSGNITGFSSDSGLVINQTLINNGATAGTVTYSVTPRIGDCSGTAAEFTVTVNPNVPVSVSVTASENPVCEGTAVTLTATPMNGGPTPAYQWIVNANNVSNANNAVFTYIPANGDQVSVLCTSSFVLCTSNNPATSDPITMTALPSPEVSFVTCFDTVTILSAQPFMLKGGIPLGGTYSGAGVNPATGIFTPSVAGTGLKTIQYTSTNSSSCSATMSKTILVKPDPVFVCGNPLTDLRDNKVYPTVQIGTQCWMQTNLDFGFQISDLLPQTDNCIPEKYSAFNTDQGGVIAGQISNLKSEILNLKSEMQNGAFYQWDELMRHNPSESSQGLCPPGWHIPTSAEWDELIVFYNGPGKAGGYIMDTLLPGGFHSYQQGTYYLNNTWAFTTGFAAGSMYWTSTLSGGRAVARGINEMNLSVSLYESSRGNALSVRCIKD